MGVGRGVEGIASVYSKGGTRDISVDGVHRAIRAEQSQLVGRVEKVKVSIIGITACVITPYQHPSPRYRRVESVCRIPVLQNVPLLAVCRGNLEGMIGTRGQRLHGVGT